MTFLPRWTVGRSRHTPEQKVEVLFRAILLYGLERLGPDH
jgi:hypothetical protein